ncbi:hypothetical protein PCE1_003109 [Barthelona sp. PCE]
MFFQVRIETKFDVEPAFLSSDLEKHINERVKRLEGHLFEPLQCHIIKTFGLEKIQQGLTVRTWGVVLIGVVFKALVYCPLHEEVIYAKVPQTSTVSHLSQLEFGNWECVCYQTDDSYQVEESENETMYGMFRLNTKGKETHARFV